MSGVHFRVLDRAATGIVNLSFSFGNTKVRISRLFSHEIYPKKMSRTRTAHCSVFSSSGRLAVRAISIYGLFAVATRPTPTKPWRPPLVTRRTDKNDSKLSGEHADHLGRNGHRQYEYRHHLFNDSRISYNANRCWSWKRAGKNKHFC